MPKPDSSARRSPKTRRATLNSLVSPRRAMVGSSRRQSLFARIADSAARATGSPFGFMAAAFVVLVWAVSGPAFGFSDTWQLVINTGTTVITFLMVFLVQATQNRDSAAIHLKLDELVRALETANNELLDMETLTPEDLEEIRKDYETLAEEARNGGAEPEPEPNAP